MQGLLLVLVACSFAFTTTFASVPAHSSKFYRPDGTGGNLLAINTWVRVNNFGEIWFARAMCVLGTRE